MVNLLNLYINIFTNMELATLLFLGNLGGTEIFVIVFVILLFFGAKKLPELARGLGKGIREFKDATKDVKENIEKAANSEDTLYLRHISQGTS
jgi:sec-independent protein translocase protein TatA